MKDKSASQLLAENNIKQFPGVEEIQIVTENLSTIKPEKVEWIWQDILAKGKITLFAGEPGVGKSQLLLYIASVLSNGGKFHFAKTNVPVSKVLLIAGEDKMSDTVIPRLKALGADIGNIEHIKGIRRVDKNKRDYYEPISLDSHIADLEDIIIKGGYSAVIIDPISSYLGSADESRNKEIRAILAQITAVCERNNLIAILNSHFNKPSGNMAKGAIYRVMGSIGFAAAARIVYAVVKDPDEKSRRLLIPIKNNIAQDENGFAYNIKLTNVQCEDFEISIGKVEWLNEIVTRSANEILNTTLESVPAKLNEAQDFLLTLLKEGSVPVSKIRQLAEEQGISIGRLYAAKDALKIYEDSNPVSKRGKLWMLPA
jgi:putative DNA primase/helicase